MAKISILDYPIDQLASLQQVALLRLQIKVTGIVHKLLTACSNDLKTKLLNMASEDEIIPPVALLGTLAFAQETWQSTFQTLSETFEAARIAAAAIPFALVAHHHQMFMGLVEGELIKESAPPKVGIQQANFLESQLEEILQAAAQRVYSDGFNLSQRVWRLDQQSLAEIKRIITEVSASGESAWGGVKRLEQYLGAGADCPRWTSTRLQLTKAQIASGDTRGLLSGNACTAQGVAYNALRLMRNEIQIVHHGATDLIFNLLPWVEKEQIHLSPQHPKPDICDDVIANGENGEGIYPKGTIALPLHVQCLCFKGAITMTDEAFVKKMRGWLNNQTTWPEMDTYTEWLNQPKGEVVGVLGSQLIKQLSFSFLVWLNGDNETLDNTL